MCFFNCESAVLPLSSAFQTPRSFLLLFAALVSISMLHAPADAQYINSSIICVLSACRDAVLGDMCLSLSASAEVVTGNVICTPRWRVFRHSCLPADISSVDTPLYNARYVWRACVCTRYSRCRSYVRHCNNGVAQCHGLPPAFYVSCISGSIYD